MTVAGGLPVGPAEAAEDGLPHPVSATAIIAIAMTRPAVPRPGGWMRSIGLGRAMRALGGCRAEGQGQRAGNSGGAPDHAPVPPGIRVKSGKDRLDLSGVSPDSSPPYRIRQARGQIDSRSVAQSAHTP